MIRFSFVLALFATLAIFHEAFAQGKDNSLEGVPAKERIVTGGGLGLGFGSVQDFVSVSPVIGYSLTRRIIGGVSLTYRYTNYKVFQPSLKLHDYGVSPFVRYTFYRGIFLQTEYEHLNYEFPTGASGETARYSFDSFLGGVGIVQPMGRNLAFFAMALYNFSYQSNIGNTPYDSPLVLRAGINVGGFLGLE